MSKKTVNTDTSSDNMNSSINKSNQSSNNTKMFILPPNVFQNICLSNSIEKGKLMNYYYYLDL